MAPLLSEINSHDPYFQWILIAMAVGTLFYAVVRPALKKNKDPLAKTASMSSLSQQRNVERQMQNLLVELSEMTRQISAQLDTRAEKLHMLIVDADQRIAELKRLSNQPGTTAARGWPDLSEASPRETVPRNIPIPEPLSFSQRDAGLSRETLARDTDQYIQREIENDRHQPIYNLSDQGRTAADIARELNRPSGEVELILALRGNA